MSFPELAARDLVNRYVKFAEDYTDEPEDGEESPREKRNKLLKTLAVLAAGGLGVAGGYQLFKHYGKDLANLGKGADSAMKDSDRSDPNNAWDAAASSARRTASGGVLGAGAGGAAGAIGAATGLTNPRGAGAKALAKALGINSRTSDASERIRMATEKPSEKTTTEKPGLLTRVFGAPKPALEPEHRSVIESITAAARDKAGMNEKQIQDMYAKLRGYMSAAESPVSALKNPLNIDPAHPSVRSAKTISQAASAAEHMSDRPGNQSPLEMLENVGRGALAARQVRAAGGSSHPQRDAAVLGASGALLDKLIGPAKNVRDPTEHVRRAQFLDVLSREAPKLELNYPSLKGWTSRIAEPLSRARAPLARGAAAGGLVAGGIEAAPWLGRQAVSLFSGDGTPKAQ